MAWLARLRRTRLGRDTDGDGSANRRTVGPGEVSAVREAEEVRAGHSAAPKVTGPADAILTGAVIGLVCFGVVMVYSASAVLAYSRHDDGQHFLVRQTIYAVIGLCGMIALARFDYHRLHVLSRPILLAAVLLLVATAFGMGKSAGGASRWIELGPIHIQPAEVAKLAMICWLAYSLSKKSRERIRSFKFGFLAPMPAAVIVMWLCMKQPDFGSAVMIGLLTFVLLFTAGARLSYILLASLAALPLIHHAVGEGYRARRITAFLSPFQYRYGEGYQIAESLMSFGAGGLNGVGIGDSRQKLFFLPEAHTDFISAIVGEELGFIGFAVMVLAYLVVLQRGFRAAFRAVDDYGTYLAVGITMFIGLQAFTNLAVALGLLPTKGLVLPFISFGGSALLVNCGAIGILLNVSRPRVGAAATVSEAESSEAKDPKLRARLVQRGGVA
jgi:cell division protein FtsW